jgi:hypothetical protein
MIIRKNNDVWRGFFGLLELKREGRLPPFITWISPPAPTSLRHTIY